METYLSDVLTQPESLRQCVEGLDRPEVLAKLEALTNRTYRDVIFTGMGSSNYCSVSAQALLTRAGRRSRRCSASELLHYGLESLAPDQLLILNSQSGESAEIIRLLDRLPKGIATVAVCNDPNSTLARRVELALPMNAREEESVTTRTYLDGVVIDLLVAYALLGLSAADLFLSIVKASTEMDAFLQNHRAITARMEEALGFPPQLCLIGRGCSTATTQAGALFLREIVRYPAFAELGGEFRHGPMEMTDDAFHALLIAPDDQTESLNHSLALEIQAHGGHVLAVTHQDWPDVPCVSVPKTDDWLSPLLTILPVQLYADSLAKRKGIRAGCFRWGSKITRDESRGN